VVECAAKLDAQVGALAIALEEQQADLEHKAQHLASLVCIVLYNITFEKRWNLMGGICHRKQQIPLLGP
jgi:hypothetical protein